MLSLTPFSEATWELLAVRRSLETPPAVEAVSPAYRYICSLLKRDTGARDPQLSGQLRAAAAISATAVTKQTKQPPPAAALVATVPAVHHGTTFSSQKCHASLHQLQAVFLYSSTSRVSTLPPLPLQCSRSVSSATQQYQQRQDQQDQQRQPGDPGEGKHGEAFEKQAAKWKAFQERVEELKTYVAVHGRLPTHSYCNPKSKILLRHWVQSKRKQYERGTLPPEMAAALDEALGEVWRVRHVQQRSFQEMLARVKSFQQQKGRLPSTTEVDGDGVKIGSWIRSRRYAYHQGSLSAGHTAACEEVPGWIWQIKVHVAAEDWLDMVREFEQANGRLPKKLETWDGMRVGIWLTSTRRAYQRGLLSSDMIAACEAVPSWVWKKVERRCTRIPFDLGICTLRSFVQAQNRLPTQKEVGGEPSELHLGKWVSNCRKRKRQGELAPDHIAALKEVPGWWWEDPGRPFRP